MHNTTTPDVNSDGGVYFQILQAAHPAALANLDVLEPRAFDVDVDFCVTKMRWRLTSGDELLVTVSHASTVLDPPRDWDIIEADYLGLRYVVYHPAWVRVSERP